MCADSLNSGKAIDSCLLELRGSLEGDKEAKVTYSSMVMFKRSSKDKATPSPKGHLQESILRTGAYYFGPMFVLDKGTSIPSQKILRELKIRGFAVGPLRHLNNAQLNLFFITLKGKGLVSDRSFTSFVKYGVENNGR